MILLFCLTTRKPFTVLTLKGMVLIVNAMLPERPENVALTDAEPDTAPLFTDTVETATLTLPDTTAKDVAEVTSDNVFDGAPTMTRLHSNPVFSNLPEAPNALNSRPPLVVPIALETCREVPLTTVMLMEATIGSWVKIALKIPTPVRPLTFGTMIQFVAVRLTVKRLLA